MDSEAMLSFLQLFCQAIDNDKIISAAVTNYTFVNKEGNRMTNVIGFAQVLDYIFIMNYDVWGSSSTPGPNAPFLNIFQDSNRPGPNMVNAISTWTESGFPSKKIIMGLSAYGYINHASATLLIHRKRAASDGSGGLKYNHYCFQSQILSKKRQELCFSSIGNCFQNRLNNIISVTNCTTQGTYNISLNTTLSLPSNNTNLPSTSVIQRATQSGAGNGNIHSYAGSQISLNDPFKWGALRKNISDPRGDYIYANGYIIAWDSCSSTHYAYCANMNTVVTYDDWNSTGIKAAYSLKEGISGVGFWEITGDRNSELVNSARKNLGL
ncbi:hypothetical protein O181_032772 [Austropuccinia psidii MF-1]|uniref:GH18 domain-containing protein n=1 Tax=Austropuccinia psidii MF-1 TaxID=1389203 RepID=A0A9Q3D036_9BASI|nr:hypothetical protein [Austropuccinia psidii MF-1]